MHEGLSIGAIVNIRNGASWVGLQATNPEQLVAQQLPAIWGQDAARVYKQNFRINQHYQSRAIVRAILMGMRKL